MFFEDFYIEVMPIVKQIAKKKRSVQTHEAIAPLAFESTGNSHVVTENPFNLGNVIDEILIHPGTAHHSSIRMAISSYFQV